MIEFKATIKSTQESLLTLMPKVRSKRRAVELSEDSDLETDEMITDTMKITEVMIKEGIYPSGEEDEDTSSKDDELFASSEYDREVDSGDENMENPAKKERNRMTFSEEPKLEEMLRDLNVLQCEACKTKFTSASDLSTHLGSVHKKPDAFITCCDLRFFGRDEWYGHMRYHLNQDAFKCGKCGLNWMSAQRLKNHEAQMHKGYKEMKHPTNDKLTKCTVCGKEVFARSLKIHMRHSHIEKRYPCSACELKFDIKSTLATHMKRDHLYVTYDCEHCSYTSKHRSNLKRHHHKM